jgi:hypothetical protein
MKKPVFIITLVFTVIVSLAFFNPYQIRYENLQVLPKDTNKYQMDSIMKHYTASLGVNCNFCHVQTQDAMKDWDFASDKNRHKLITRDMMRMTDKINGGYFKDEGQAVTCYTCHGGKKHPAAIPPKKEEDKATWTPGKN